MSAVERVKFPETVVVPGATNANVAAVNCLTMLVVLAEVTVTVPRENPVPTFSLKVISPVPAVIDKLGERPADESPFKVPAKLIFPPSVTMTTSPVRMVLEKYLTGSAVVVTLPAVKVAPDPVKFTLPSDVMSPASVIISVLLAVKVTTPLTPAAKVSTVLFKVIEVVDTFKPATAEYTCAPRKVVSPVPASWRKLLAVIACAVTSVAELIVIALSGAKLPTAPLRKMLPVPAINVRFCSPSRVLANVIFPRPTLVLMVMGPVNSVADMYVTSLV